MKNEQMYDIRVVDKYIKRGLVSEKEYAAFIAGLTDIAEEGISVDTKIASDATSEEEE